MNPTAAHLDEEEHIEPGEPVTENLGVPDTIGVALEDARAEIQDAWLIKVAAEGADGPDSLNGTCAALDPAL
jgi:hypothetical protein